MPAELICPIHGPYNAALGTCPYCHGSNRPAQPTPLDQDDNLPTDIGFRPPAPAGSRGDEEAPTELPRGGKAGRKFLDFDEDEETSLGKRGREDVTEVEFKESTALAILWVKEGQRRGKIYHVKEETVIGRKDGDLIIDDAKVSNPHAKIIFEANQFVVWDFGSRNGTFVNGERIRAATPLKENDVLKFGETVFVFKVLE